MDQATLKIIVDPSAEQQSAQAGALSAKEYQQLVKDFGDQQAKIIAAAAQAQTQASKVVAAQVAGTPASAATAPPPPSNQFAAFQVPAGQAGTQAVHPMAAGMGQANPNAQASQAMIAGMTQAGQAAAPPQQAAAAFDPYAAAKDRRESQVKSEQIKLAYEQMYGDAQKTKSAFGVTLDVAQQMRGTIGGVFGTFVGAGLDIMAEVRKARTSPISDVRQDAQRRMFGTPQGQAGSPASAIGASSLTNAAAGTAESGASPAASLASSATIAAAALTAVAVAGLAVNKELNQLVEKYGQYSPEIATAQATADVRSIIGDMRRAQESGPQLAQFIEAQSKFEQKYEDAKLALLTSLMPIATGIFDILKMAMPILQVIIAPVELVAKIIGMIFNILKWFQDNQEEQGFGDAFNFNPLTDIVAPAATL